MRRRRLHLRVSFSVLWLLKGKQTNQIRVCAELSFQPTSFSVYTEIIQRVGDFKWTILTCKICLLFCFCLVLSVLISLFVSMFFFLHALIARLCVGALCLKLPVPRYKKVSCWDKLGPPPRPPLINPFVRSTLGKPRCKHNKPPCLTSWTHYHCDVISLLWSRKPVSCEKKFSALSDI